jgi:hypothetical protein
MTNGGHPYHVRKPAKKATAGPRKSKPNETTAKSLRKKPLTGGRSTTGGE